MGREVLASIRTQYPSFTRVEKSIADYVLDHGGEVVNMRIRELAFRCSVGESSIVRFCRTIGLGGYDDLRLSLAAALEREPLPADETEAVAGNIADELCRLHCQSLQNARSILKAETLRAVSEKMLAARQIYFFAPAGAHALAAHLSDTVLQTIGKGVSLTPPYPKALCRREMNAQDLAFLLSTDTAPDNADVLESVAAQLQKRGVELVSLSCCGKTPAQQYCQEKLFCGTIEFFGGSMPDRLALCYVIETLCAACVAEIHPFPDMDNE